MSVVFCYLDFFIKSFDIESKTSRKCYWLPFLINVALIVCLVCLGLWVVPAGRPRAIYIGVATTFTVPLFIPSITSMARRFNDINVLRRWLFLILLPCIGYIAVLGMCARPSEYGTKEDLTSYRKGQLYDVVKKFMASAVTIFPFVYLPYSVFKIVMADTPQSLGIGIWLFVINAVICIFTAIEIKTYKYKKFLLAWKVVKTLTVIASAITSIVFYYESPNIIDAFFTVYLCFYVVIGPFVLINNIYKFIKAIRQKDFNIQE